MKCCFLSCKPLCNIDFIPYITLIFLTGMRVSECLPICWNDVLVTHDKFVIITAKTLKRRNHPKKDVPINLRNKNNKYLFDTYVKPYLNQFRTSPDDKMFRFSRQMVQKHCKKLGFKTVHNLRRSFINNMAASGASLFDVASMLNLSDTNAIKEYWHKFQTNTLKERLKKLGV